MLEIKNTKITNYEDEQKARGTGQLKSRRELNTKNFYDKMYSKFKNNNQLYLDDNMWTTAATRGELDNLIYLLNENKTENEGLEALKSWGMGVDYDTYMLALSIPTLNNEEKKTRLNEAGDYSFGDLTDQEWAKKVLEATNNKYQAEYIEANKENMKWWQKVGAGIVSFVGNSAAGVTSWAAHTYNLAEGIYNFIASGFDSNEFLKGYAIEDDYLYNVAEQMKYAIWEFDRVTMPWVDAVEAYEQGYVGANEDVELGSKAFTQAIQNSGYGGGLTTWGRWWQSGLQSFGEMLPFMIMPIINIAGKPKLSKALTHITKTGGFYVTNVFSASIGDTVKDAQLNGISYKDLNAGEVVGNAALKTVGQYMVEVLLGKVLGFTGLDAMMGVGDEVTGAAKWFTKAASATGAKAAGIALGRGALSMFKEGLEEVLQDMSDNIIDMCFGGTYADRAIENMTWQNLGDAFVVGALTSGVIGTLSSASVIINRNARGIAIDEKTGKAYRMGVFQQLNYNQAIQAMATWQNTLNDKNASIQDKADAAFRLNGVVSTVGNVLKTFGTERSQKALELLTTYQNKMSTTEEKATAKAQLSNTEFAKSLFNDYVEANKQAIEKFVTQKAQAKLQKALAKEAELLKKNGVTKISDIVTQELDTNDPDVNIPEQSAKAVKHLLKETKSDMVVATDGKTVVKSDDVIFAPESLVKEGKISEILEGIAYDKAIKVIGPELSKKQNELILEEFKKLSGRQDATIDDALVALLFDKSFYTYILLKTNETQSINDANEAIKILAIMDTIVKGKIASDVDKGTLTQAAYQKLVERIQENMRAGLVVYAINYTNIDLDAISAEILPASYKELIRNNENVIATNKANRCLESKQRGVITQDRIADFDNLIDKFIGLNAAFDEMITEAKQKIRSAEYNDRFDAVGLLRYLMDIDTKVQLTFLKPDNPTKTTDNVSKAQIVITEFFDVEWNKLLTGEFEFIDMSTEAQAFVKDAGYDIENYNDRIAMLRERLYHYSNNTLTLSHEGHILQVVDKQKLVKNEYLGKDGDKKLIADIKNGTIKKVSDICKITIDKTIGNLDLKLDTTLNSNGQFSENNPTVIVVNGNDIVNNIMHEVTHAAQYYYRPDGTDNISTGATLDFIQGIEKSKLRELEKYIKDNFPLTYRAMLMNTSNDLSAVIYFNLDGEMQAMCKLTSLLFETGFTWNKDKTQITSPDGKQQWSLTLKSENNIKEVINDEKQSSNISNVSDRRNGQNTVKQIKSMGRKQTTSIDSERRSRNIENRFEKISGYKVTRIGNIYVNQKAQNDVNNKIIQTAKNKYGAEVLFYKGLIYDKDGEQISAKGFTDGTKIFIREDLSDKQAEKVLQHEYFHIKRNQNKTKYSKLKKSFLSGANKEQLSMIIDKYAEVYVGLSAAEVLEEILADISAGVITVENSKIDEFNKLLDELYNHKSVNKIQSKKYIAPVNIQYAKDPNSKLMAITGIPDTFGLIENLKKGYMTMPSIGINSTLTNTQFGNMYIIWDKEAVDLEKNDINIYYEDAWTSRVPITKNIKVSFEDGDYNDIIISWFEKTMNSAEKYLGFNTEKYLNIYQRVEKALQSRLWYGPKTIDELSTKDFVSKFIDGFRFENNVIENSLLNDISNYIDSRSDTEYDNIVVNLQTYFTNLAISRALKAGTSMFKAMSKPSAYLTTMIQMNKPQSDIKQRVLNEILDHDYLMAIMKLTNFEKLSNTVESLVDELLTDYTMLELEVLINGNTFEDTAEDLLINSITNEDSKQTVENLFKTFNPSFSLKYITDDGEVLTSEQGQAYLDKYMTEHRTAGNEHDASGKIMSKIFSKTIGDLTEDDRFTLATSIYHAAVPTISSNEELIAESNRRLENNKQFDRYDIYKAISSYIDNCFSLTELTTKQIRDIGVQVAMAENESVLNNIINELVENKLLHDKNKNEFLEILKQLNQANLARFDSIRYFEAKPLNVSMEHAQYLMVPEHSDYNEFWDSLYMPEVKALLDKYDIEIVPYEVIFDEKDDAERAIKNLPAIKNDKFIKFMKDVSQVSESRKISNKVAEQSNLKYFIKKGQQIQLDERVQDFVKDTTADFDKLEKPIQKAIKNGSLTLLDIQNYVETANSMNDYTFQTIAKYIYENDEVAKLTYAEMVEILKHLEEIDTLKLFLNKSELIDKKMSYTKMIKAYDKIQEQAKTDKKVADALVGYTKLASTIKPSGSRQFIPYDVDIDQMHGAFFRHYNGTIRSLSNLNNYGKNIAHNQEALSLSSNEGEGANLKSRKSGAWNWIDRMRKADINYGNPEQLNETLSDLDRQDKINIIQEHIIQSIIEQSKANNWSQEEVLEQFNNQRNRLDDLTDDEINKLYMAATSEGIVETTPDYMNIRSELEKRYVRKNQNKYDGKYASRISARATAKQAGRKIATRLAGLKTRFNKLSPELQQLFDRKADGHYELNDKYQQMSDAELEAIIPELQEASKMLAERIRIVEAAKKSKLNAIKRANRQAEKMLDRPAGEGKKTMREKVDIVHKVVMKQETFNVVSREQAPHIVENVLATSWDKTRKTTVQGLDNNIDQNIANAETFFTNNPDLLNMSTAEAEQAARWFMDAKLTGTMTSQDMKKFGSVQTLFLGYVLEQAHDGGQFADLSSNLKRDIEAFMRDDVSLGATKLSLWKGILKRLNPVEVMMSQSIAIGGVELSESEQRELLTAATSGDMETVAKLQERILERIKSESTNKKNILRKVTAVRSMSMLSSPLTWLRNIVSNFMLKRLNKWSSTLGQRIFTSKTKQGQLKFTGNITPEIQNFISKNFLDNKLFDTLISNISKYNPSEVSKKFKNKDGSIDKNAILAQMVIKSMYGKYYSENMFKNDFMNKIYQGLMKKMSDNNYVREAAIRYFGKIIAEKGYDLSKGVTDQIMTDFANAVGIAMADYMHSDNFFNTLEQIAAEHGEVTLFAYKNLVPFMATSWNWFKAMIRYSPIGLVNSIIKLTNLERQIIKQEHKWAQGKSQVSPEYTEYLIRRDLGSGVIGTIGFGLGTLLAALGFIDLDDDDYGTPKLVIGDLEIDVSSIFGTSSVLAGAALITDIKDSGLSWNNILSGLDKMLDVTLDGFFLTELMSLDLYSGGGSFATLLDLVESIGLSFIPNGLAWIAGATYTGTLRKKGFFGKAAAKIPFLAGIVNEKKVDPYTGETGNIWDIFNRVLPYFDIKMKSRARETAESLGLSKKELKGQYTINNEEFNLSDKEVSEINKQYGEWNATALTAFLDNKQKYKVKDEATGNYKMLTYSQMNDKQRKNTISTIMSNNAENAKILAWLNAGYKYYASANKYAELRQLGVKGKLYKGNKGFVKE